MIKNEMESRIRNAIEAFERTFPDLQVAQVNLEEPLPESTCRIRVVVNTIEKGARS